MFLDVQNVQQLGLGILIVFGIGTSYSVTASAFPQKVRIGYSEVCNQTLKCRSDAWLSCDETTGTCRCIKQDEMVYDEVRGKCVVLVGERCKLGFEGTGKGSFWYEKGECVSGAVCGPSGICSCSPGTFELQEANQTVCQPVKGFGGSCSQSLECDVNKFLSCVDGSCVCDPSGAIYNNKSFSINDGRGTVYVAGDICVGRVGSACSYGSGKYCVQNAVCSGGGGADSSVCQCYSSFAVTSELLCGLEYDGSCGSAGSVCSDHFICTGYHTNNIRCYGSNPNPNTGTMCKCPNPALQEFDSSSKTCRGREGSPCDPRQMNSCTKRASCVERDQQFFCECDRGFVVTKDGKCQRGYGTSCHYGSGVFVPAEELCDEVPSLKCIDGSCRCPNLVDVYEDGRRRCVFPVGVACRESSVCVENGVCESHPGGKGLPGRCACQKGFRVGSNHRTCKPESRHQDETTDRN